MDEGWDEDMKEKQRSLWGQLEARERQEGIYWKHKSKVKWMQDGERNTKLFHNSVLQNRNSSKIHKLKRGDGSQVETRREIEEELTQHFVGILNEDEGERGGT